MVALFTKIMGSGTSSVLLLARHSIVEGVLGKETPPLSFGLCSSYWSSLDLLIEQKIRGSLSCQHLWIVRSNDYGHSNPNRSYSSAPRATPINFRLFKSTPTELPWYLTGTNRCTSLCKSRACWEGVESCPSHIHSIETQLQTCLLHHASPALLRHWQPSPLPC